MIGYYQYIAIISEYYNLHHETERCITVHYAEVRKPKLLVKYVTWCKFTPTALSITVILSSASKI